jgi:glycosyltransferase involved in cell wall biosynthesis
VSEPLVSVVTPFHNTALYLAQCIESVLAQSYGCFEYILVDNCSTDASGEIAETYARRDPRIRLIRRSNLLSQVQNYNAALAEISADSQYCKVVQADDWIFPECLRRMVQAFELSEKIGLVSSYDLKGATVRGNGFPYSTSPVPGREVARLLLENDVYVFGSPSTVMYRSSLVRGPQPFYQEGLLHEDTEKCMQILEHWDFAFVPQVLSFLRTGNESISGSVRDLQPGDLDAYIIAQRYAATFLDPKEAAAVKRVRRQSYYSTLAGGVVRLRGAPFWRYHKQGLKTLGETIDWPYLAWQTVGQILWMAVNPGTTLARALRFRTKHKEESK